MRRASTRLSLAFFAFTAAAMLADVVLDWVSGSPPPHVFFEAVIALLALVGMAFYWREWARERSRARRLNAELETARHESAKWRDEADRWRRETREILDGLGSAIDRQFDRWALTPAEREVALLLLKGLSHKEVGTLRGTSERTARQQGNAVYRKAEVSGRAELSAFFLEDLLLPDSPALLAHQG